MRKMPSHHWEIKGYDGSNELFSSRVSGVLSNDEIATLLQRLAARHLNEQEVISACLRRNDPNYSALLHANIDASSSRGVIISVGQNPHYAGIKIRQPPE